MTADREKTSPLAETLDEMAGEELDKAMRTTLVQPIRWPRQPDLAKTRYWERLSFDRGEPKRPAASYGIGGNTRIGLGPDDPIQQAVKAAKAARIEGETPSAERPRVFPKEAELPLPSQAKTMRLPAIDVLQLMAAKVQEHIESKRTQTEPEATPPTAAGRRPRPLVLVLAALSVVLSLVSVTYLVPARSSDAREEADAATPVTPSATRPTETEAATETEAKPAAKAVGAPETAQAVAVRAPEATSASASVAPQTTEKAAVDALFAGDYARAGRHYASLAKGYPEQPAFSEAARILGRNAAAAAE